MDKANDYSLQEKYMFIDYIAIVAVLHVVLDYFKRKLCENMQVK